MTWMPETEGRWGCWVLCPRRPFSWFVPTLYVSRRHTHLFWMGLVVNYWRRAPHFGFGVTGGRPFLYFGPFEAYVRWAVR